MTRLIVSFCIAILLMAVVQFGLTAMSIKHPWLPLAVGLVSVIGLFWMFERIER